MSRETFAEALKGGILGMGILMLILLIGGGLLKWGLGDKPKGPAFKVTVNIQDRAGQPAGTVPADADRMFAIPEGAVDVAEPERVGPGGLAGRPGTDSRMFIEAGFKTLTCRHFAWEASPNETVTACGFRMDSALAAFSVYGRMRPNADSLKVGGIDRGCITVGGFRLVRGDTYFEISRETDGDNARKLALAFLNGLAAQDFGPDAAGTIGRLPAESMVAGTERILLAGTYDRNIPTVVVSADYMIDGAAATGSFADMESETAAAGAVDAIVADLEKSGAERKSVDGAPAGTFFYLKGQIPEAVGSAGRKIFMIRGAQGISATARLARIFAMAAAEPVSPSAP